MGKSFLMVVDLRHASWPLRKRCHPSLYPAFPLDIFQVVSFLVFLIPSVTNGTWSPCSKVWRSQTLWQTWGPLLIDTPQYFFVTDFVRPSYVKKPFSKATSHSSPAFARPLSLRSIIRLHSEKYPRWQSFFRQRLARWRLLSAVLFFSKRVFGLFSI